MTASAPQVSLTSVGARAPRRLPQCRVPLPHVPGSGLRLPQTEVQKQRPRRGAMTEAAAAAPPGSPRGRRGGRPLAARRGGAARRSRSRRRRCCPSSPCPRHSPARLLAPFSLRFRLKGGREKELGRHFPSAAAATATARRAGGRTKRLSEADSSRRGGLGGGRSALPGREEEPGVAVGVRARAADGGACLCGAGGGGFTLCPRPPSGVAVPDRAQTRRNGGRPEKGFKREEKAAAPRRRLPLPPSPRPPARKVRAAPGAGGEESGGPGRSRRRAPPPAGPRRPGRGAVCKLRPFCGAESARATLLHHVVGAAAAPLLLLPLPFLLLLALPVAPISPSLC